MLKSAPTSALQGYLLDFCVIQRAISNATGKRAMIQKKKPLLPILSYYYSFRILTDPTADYDAVEIGAGGQDKNDAGGAGCPGPGGAGTTTPGVPFGFQIAVSHVPSRQIAF